MYRRLVKAIESVRRFTERLPEKLKSRIEGNPGLKAVFVFFKNFFADNIPGIAAETAFFLLLSVFPLSLIIASTLNRYSVDIKNELFGYLLPSSVAEFLSVVLEQVPKVSAMPMIPVTISLWSASVGIWALMRGICRAYTGDNPERPFLKRFTALFFVIVFVAVVALGLAMWIIGENLLSSMDTLLSVMIFFIRYAVAFIGIFLFILGLYMYTPGYDIKKRDMLPGAAAASVAWLIVNKGFEIYVNQFSGYPALYGSVAAFLGLVLWLFIICIVILAGAEINSAMILYRKSKGAQEPLK